MGTIINDDFLLQSEHARRLYNDFAKDEPIIDYHCHLPPDQLGNDHRFENLTQIWLYGDHYKWRAMRTMGVDEKYITGGASDEEKFMWWAKTVPMTVRNPLFHWTHLELNRYFGIDEYLNESSAKKIYEMCNEKLATADFSARGIPKMMNVRVICTTDDPTDDLSYHQKLKADSYEVKVYPTFRPDNILRIDDRDFFLSYISKLSQASGIEISSVKNLIDALRKRVDYFESAGCKLSDHGLNYIDAVDFDDSVVCKALDKALNGNPVSIEEANQYKSYILNQLGKMYHEKGWTQQFHLGAIRNNNQRLLDTLGADVGVDSIGDFSHAVAMSKFFNRLDQENSLAKTIVYNLNPADNEIFATMMGNFQDGTVAGKMQFGSGWWFLDQKDGMEKQINALSNMGILSQFVGMLTDSRSFLSYPRHEYFRRTLCNLLGNDMTNGELPIDYDWIGSIVKNICYANAEKYFGFEI
ncbi:glucuronate isomerase [Marinigracilibium pacificum]|uniref:Uronate isomerase n=1 Tax=Marinigracilibium pacificum TaxID=2729599 RepID=A0A848J9G7_9BACT|nr:glucuronate isomerase [Marinigracilibium pacificum]NMM49692.1 glucuronate isomerase [Marinigracilibium pacificum]